MTGGIITMNYNSKSLLDVKFKKNVKGYDAYQVDSTLDQVIDDYKFYEKILEENRQTISSLESQNKTLKEKLRQSEILAKKLQKTVDAIPDSPDVTKSNIVYLQRIADLEKALYKRGVDPKKI